MPDPATLTTCNPPLAAPRWPVGNSSGPYTARAGMASAPMIDASIDETHRGQPNVR
jgi:hypothetical protein